MEDNKRNKAISLLKNVIKGENNKKLDIALNSFIDKYDVIYISLCKNRLHKWCYVISRKGNYSMEITDISITGNTLRYRKLNDTLTMDTTVLDDVIL